MIIVEIVSGEGGADSRLFVDELASAYVRYARLLGFAVSILASRDGHMTLLVSGAGSWGAFRHEPGKHRNRFAIFHASPFCAKLSEKNNARCGKRGYRCGQARVFATFGV